MSRNLFNFGRFLVSLELRNKLSPSSLCFATKNMFTTSRLDTSKKARKPFIIFSDEMRAEVIKTNPDMKVTEISKVMGKLWEGLAEDKKKDYSRKYLIEKEEAMKAEEAMSFDELQKLKDEKVNKKKKKKDKAMKALKESLGKPRVTGTNPFMLYCQSMMPSRGDAPLKMFILGATANWKKMSVEDKQPFKDEAKKNSAVYKVAHEIWERKMLEEGHEDVLPKRRVEFLKGKEKEAEEKKTKGQISNVKKPKGETKT